jgi:hypothetical protein
MPFTPRKSYETDDRHEMRLSDEDQAKIRRGRWKAEVTDLNTGIRYEVKGASCGLPRCFCDAVVTKEFACS